MRTGIQFIDRTLRYCISTSRLFLVFAFGRDVEKSDFTLNSEKIANNIISDLAVLLHSPMLKTKTKSIFACFLLSCLLKVGWDVALIAVSSIISCYKYVIS